ncbi:hypothetical protein AXF42_Ash019189 [Apostasia shenzhenica]|uniref:Protein ARV n=1 Tax=Apostasia shenzhenica TaxID=1088818 RepID=A0A2I0B2G1_9ASPA|nr:hypothetical protein AXF42_Ash019189 [Apostasia shenzhenica]
MPPDPDSGEQDGLGLLCVNCGWGVARLFVQYSPGNIRLMKCDNCKAVADPYIECEFMIIFIDLILHKTRAYRHLLYNMLHAKTSDIKGILLKSSLMFLILDAFRVSLVMKGDNSWDLLTSNMAFTRTCIKVLLDVLFGNFIFISVLWLAVRLLLKLKYDESRYKEIMLAILVSSYFKIFLLAMMIWEFPSSVVFIVDIFVLSSNTVAFSVITQLRTSTCIALFFTAHAAKFLASRWLQTVL